MEVKPRNLLTFLFVGILFVFFSCNNGTKVDPDIDDDLNDPNDSSQVDKDQLLQVQQIFINVPSPIEMASILQRSGASYNGEVLNSTDNNDKYTTIASSALNLGVYGADLSYTRMFDQIQESVNYLAVIRKLSDRLGIPQDEGSFTVAKLEENIENKDTLLNIISDTYASADTYLKENDRGSTAALIILGGWTEALFIATHILEQDNPDKEIMDRIAEQKFSLENLIKLLEVYQGDEAVELYLPTLVRMRAVFEKVEFRNTKGEIATDTVKKITTIGGEQEILVTMDNVKEITAIVDELRLKIIS